MSMHQLGHAQPMPVIGHPEIYYVKHIKQAEQTGNNFAVEAFKVARYVTLAMDQKITWDEKFRYYRHVLKHHCTAPPGADTETQGFFEKLHETVKRYASQEAMRILKREHDGLRARRERGEPKENLKVEATTAFTNVLGMDGACPAWMRPDTFEQVRTLRNQWL